MMLPEGLSDVAMVETMCAATVSQQGNQVIMSESPSWALSSVGKLNS